MKLNSSVLALIFSFVFSVALDAQTYPTGLRDNPEIEKSYNTLERAPSPGSKSGEESLRSIMRVDLSDLAPPVTNQKQIGSCVGHSVSNALSISHAKQNNWNAQERADNAFSAMFIYNKIKWRDCPDGSTLEDAGNHLKTEGDCLRKDFDNMIDLNDCNAKPAKEVIAKAKQYVIQDYMILFKSDASLKDKVFYTKKSLADSIPVVIGMNIRNNFYVVKGEFWDPALDDTRPSGAHAMCVVGFSESKKAFKIMNSWGTRWGQNGYIWVKYKDYGEFCRYGFQYIIKDTSTPPEEEEKRMVTVKGQFGFQQFLFDDDDNPVPTPIKTTYGKGYEYDLEKKDWEFGDLFQFIIKDVPKKRYVYAFSVDGNGFNIHYPRGVKFDDVAGLFGSGESPIIQSTETIFVPTEETALRREAGGKDHICILYSAKKIEDYKERFLKVKNSTADFNTRVQEAFGDILIDASDIEYEKDAIKFVAKSSGKKVAVPVMVTMIGD